LFFGEQLEQAKEKLTAAEDAMSKTEKSTGVLEIGSQARALIESAAGLHAQVAAKEVQIESMRSFAADDNPELLLAKQELAALKAQLAQIAESGKDSGSGINLSKGRVTEEGMEYVRRFRELKYQEAVYELLAKEYEVAKLDEAREGAIVQVVDPAEIPDRKASPHRTLIVLGATFFSLFLATFWVWLRRSFALASELPENRDRLRTIRELWKSHPKEA
jgi:tyrosine-protein kinase Etk/Wzc